MKKFFILLFSLSIVQACSSGGGGGSSSGESGASNPNTPTPTPTPNPATLPTQNSNNDAVFADITAGKIKPAVGTTGSNDFYFFLDTTKAAYSIRQLGDDANPHPTASDKIPASATDLNFRTIGTTLYATYTDNVTKKALERTANGWVESSTTPARLALHLVRFDNKFYAAAKQYNTLTDDAQGTPVTITTTNTNYTGGTPVDPPGPQTRNPVLLDGKLTLLGHYGDISMVKYQPTLFELSADGKSFNEKGFKSNLAEADLAQFDVQAIASRSSDKTDLAVLQKRDGQALKLMNRTGASDWMEIPPDTVTETGETLSVKALVYQGDSFVLMINSTANQNGKFTDKCYIRYTKDLAKFEELTVNFSRCLLVTSYDGVLRFYTEFTGDPSATTQPLPYLVVKRIKY